MALHKFQRFVPCVKRNAGILKTDQVEVGTLATAPSDANLAAGRFYHDTTEDRLVIRSADGTWKFIPKEEFPVHTVNADATIPDLRGSAGLIVVDEIAADVYITLPNAVGNDGVVYRIAKINTGGSVIVKASNSLYFSTHTGSYYGDGDLDAVGDAVRLVSYRGSWIVTGRIIV